MSNNPGDTRINESGELERVCHVDFYEFKDYNTVEQECLKHLFESCARLLTLYNVGAFTNQTLLITDKIILPEQRATMRDLLNEIFNLGVCKEGAFVTVHPKLSVENDLVFRLRLLDKDHELVEEKHFSIDVKVLFQELYEKARKDARIVMSKHGSKEQVDMRFLTSSDDAITSLRAVTTVHNIFCVLDLGCIND